MNPNRNQQIKELFITCCNLNAADRDSILERRCADDTVLRGDVESMLEQDGVPLLFEEKASKDDLSEADNYKLRTSIGGYRILGKIDEGGMGIVYHALQPNPRRIVALKVMRSSLPTQGARERFARECSVLARFEHQGIAKIFEAGTYESEHGSQPWFAMEFVDGLPLTRYADDHQLSLRERVSLFTQVCHAVQHAHERGVLHRDIKPANILVNQQGQVKVIDFGVARALEADDELGQYQTLTGEFVGTPLYMSPEQHLETPEGVGISSDVFSLGVTLYELLTGVPPYELRGRGKTEIARIVCEESPLRPSTQSSEISKDLDAVLLCAIEKETTRRYASVRDLNRDLQSFLEHRPVSARAASFIRRASFWLHRHPTAAVIIAVGTVIMTSLITLVLSTLHAHWRSAEDIDLSWQDGDLLAVHNKLAAMPAWAETMFLQGDVVGDHGINSEATTAVVRELLADGNERAQLLAARYLERDGALVHEVLARFLARGLRSEGSVPTELSATLEIVARMFYERPDASAADVLASRGFRSALETLCIQFPPASKVSEGGLSHLDRLRIMTALSGCGDPHSVEVMLAGMRRGAASEETAGQTRVQATETVRLTVHALEALIRRGHACDYLPRLYAMDMDAVLHDANRALHSLHEQGRGIRSLEALFITDAIARRTIGVPPCPEPMTVGPLLSKHMVEAARGDKTARDALLANAESYVGITSPAWAGHLLHHYTFALECCNLYEPNMEAVEIAVKNAIKSRLKESEARRLVQHGVERARAARRGINQDLIPDLDTHLGEFLAFENPPWTASPTRLTASVDERTLAVWDFTSDQVKLGGGAKTVSWRSLRKQAEEIRSQIQYQRLGLPGLSAAELGFEVPVNRTAILEIDTRKATRTLLPYLGEAFIDVSLDGTPFGSYRIESIEPSPLRISLGRDVIGSGAHKIRITLGVRSNATLRLFVVRVLIQ